MFWTVTLSLLKGMGVTAEIFALTLLFSLPLGLLICLGSMSRLGFVRLPFRGLIWLIRGTPLMLQIITIYYGPGLLFDLPLMPRFIAAIVAFSLNYACYFSEIYRGGIEAVPTGQYEAGQVLGMTRGQIFFQVTLLQVVKRILPPMGNEIITLVKDTSLVRVIAVYEIIWNSQAFAKSDGLVWPLFYTAAFYLVFNGLLTLLFGYIERRLSYFR